MNFHEYQAKEIFESYGIPVPAGLVARTVDEAVAAAEKLGGEAWVVKAQVHAGGRGKAGGVKFSTSLEAVKENATNMLGMTIETYQTGGMALPLIYQRCFASVARGRRGAWTMGSWASSLLEMAGAKSTWRRTRSELGSLLLTHSCVR